MDNLDKSFAPPRQHQIPSIYPFIHFILVLRLPPSRTKTKIGFQVRWLHENRNNYPFIRIIRFGHLPPQKMAGSISPAALRRTSVQCRIMTIVPGYASCLIQQSFKQLKNVYQYCNKLLQVKGVYVLMWTYWWCCCLFTRAGGSRWINGISG